jgi:hypothetical protein
MYVGSDQCYVDRLVASENVAVGKMLRMIVIKMAMTLIRKASLMLEQNQGKMNAMELMTVMSTAVALMGPVLAVEYRYEHQKPQLG